MCDTGQSSILVFLLLQLLGQEAAPWILGPSCWISVCIVIATVIVSVKTSKSSSDHDIQKLQSQRHHYNMSLIKRKKKLKISPPSNFVHKVHTGYDIVSNTFTGLPRQWRSLVSSPPGNISGYRPAPFADPQHITQTEVMDLTRDTRGQKHVSTRGRHQTSIVRSNSLRRPAAEFDQDSLEDKPNINASMKNT